MTAGSSMQAMICTGPWHCPHSLMSMRNTRFRRRAQVIIMDGMYVGFPLHQWVQPMRQGKDQMKVGRRQQFVHPRRQPTFLRQRLTLGTVPVAAGMIANLHTATLPAHAYRRTEYGRAASLDRFQR
jgi:hypothetical protein